MDRISPPSRQFDVIVTAGDRSGSRPVLKKNKVFLPIAGIPVINYVLSAIERAHCTARIIVVGDKARLEEALAIPNNPFKGHRPVVLVEQGNTLYDNVWSGFLHTLPGVTPGPDMPRQPGAPHELDPHMDKAVLIMSGDIPLATPAEIDAFADSCDLTRYDYFLGITAEPTLRPYYPQNGQAGIRMAYFTLRDLNMRQNNLHLVKPLRIGNRFLIQRIYDARYQREWRNIIKVCWQLATARDISLRTLGAFGCLHAARTIARLGWECVPILRPFFLELPMLASVASQSLRTRFTTVTTPYGGCTLDVDNAEHYKAICLNFTRWLTHQEQLAQELKQQA